MNAHTRTGREKDVPLPSTDDSIFFPTKFITECEILFTDGHNNSYNLM